MIDALPEILQQRPRRQLEADRRAAVLVPIIEDGGPRRLLLTRRTDTLSSHKGQVAFPGGMIDPDDVDARAAALREAREEVALPASHVDVLGWLDDFPTIRETLVVTPIVGVVRNPPALVAEPGEVARIFSIPLAVLRDPKAWRWEVVEWRGQNAQIYYLDHDGETLWGLSARIVLHLLQLSPAGAPIPLPGPW